MDWSHLLILTVVSIELIVLGIAVYALVYAAATLHQVEESNQRIAEMANRNERMTQSILQKVYDMQTRQ
jgi:type II secretory pathway component PulJ